MPDATVTTIRRMREAAGLSLRELSRRSGINPGRLSIIERGVTATEDETARLLSALTTAAAAKEAPDARHDPTRPPVE